MPFYLVFAICYLYFNSAMDLGFAAAKPLEQLLGTLIVTIFTAFIEKIIYHMSYSLVGELYDAQIITSRIDGRNLHWLLRLIFMILAFNFSLSPLSDMLLTPIIHNLYQLLDNQMQMLQNEFISEFMDAISF